MAKKAHRQLDYFLEGVNEPKPPALADKRTSITLILAVMASAGCASVATSGISVQTPTQIPPKETVKPENEEIGQEDEEPRVEDNSSECDKSKKGKKQKNCPEKADDPVRQKHPWRRKLHNPLLDGNDEHKQLKRDEKRKILTQNTRRGSKWLWSV